MMDRREALARIAAITGSIVIGGELFATGCSRPAPERATSFSTADVALLDEIAETIIPATDTPGAKAAGVGAFMAMMAKDCYDDATYASFRTGLTEVERLSRKRNDRAFAETTPAQRTALLNDLDAEQRRHTRSRSEDEPPHYFKLMKELALLGYFSSEIGCTKALRYVESPGAYHGDVPYRKGEKAWFNPTRRIG
jgi:glucoside 3-dehydrogenase (cytochrome c) hitch-hiker subunit